MRKLLKNAILVHHALHGEKITYTAMAAILWPDSRGRGKDQNLQNLSTGRTRLSTETLLKLVEVFPETTADYWLGLVDYGKLLKRVYKYNVREFDKNIELRALLNLLQEGLYSKTLINKYL